MKFNTPEDVINQEYLNYEQQDQLLVDWFLDMTSPILTKMVDLDTSFQIWTQLRV